MGFHTGTIDKHDLGTELTKEQKQKELGTN